MTILYGSKRKKKLDAISRYWKAQAEALAERSNDAPEMDSGDSQTHPC